jgi:hypothetical protein
MNDIKFIFLEAKDMGSILKRDQVIGNYKPDKNLTTTEKFIKITVAAQNKGKMNTKYNEWDIGNIVDSQGRNFIPADFSASPWLPQQNQCGAVLEPEFQPIPCVKMYKVSRESKDLKIQVLTTKEGQSGKDVAYLDLIVTK